MIRCQAQQQDGHNHPIYQHQHQWQPYFPPLWIISITSKLKHNVHLWEVECIQTKAIDCVKLCHKCIVEKVLVVSLSDAWTNPRTVVIVYWYATVANATVVYPWSLDDVTSRTSFAQNLVFVQILGLVLSYPCVLSSLMVWIRRCLAVLFVIRPVDCNAFVALVVDHTDGIVIINGSFFSGLLFAKRHSLRIITHWNFYPRVVLVASTFLFNVCLWWFRG